MPDGIITNQELIDALSAKTGYKAEEWSTGGNCMNAVLLLDHDGVAAATYLMFPPDGWAEDDPSVQYVGLFNDDLFDGHDSEGVSFRVPYALRTASEVAEWVGGILTRFFTA